MFGTVEIVNVQPPFDKGNAIFGKGGYALFLIDNIVALLLSDA